MFKITFFIFRPTFYRVGMLSNTFTRKFERGSMFLFFLSELLAIDIKNVNIFIFQVLEILIQSYQIVKLDT